VSRDLVGAIQEERHKGCEEDDGCHCCEPTSDPSPLRSPFLLGAWFSRIIDHCLSNVSLACCAKRSVGGLSDHIAHSAGLGILRGTCREDP
jgi:hypothetical protein